MGEAVALSKIRIDGDTQSRVKINNETVAEYRAIYEAKSGMPDLLVFFDGSDYWLADGFHRYHAASQAGLASVGCIVKKGTVEDARLASSMANKAHGLRRTNADKRKAVKMILGLPDWQNKSSSAIADAVGVGDDLVAEIRKAMEPAEEPQVSENETCAEESPGKKRVGKDGKAQAAKKKKKEPAAKKEEKPPQEEATPEPLKDAVGGIVPDELFPIFTQGEEFQEHRRALSALGTWLDKTAAEPVGRYINLQAVKADLRNLKEALKFSAPHAVCPYCKAKKKKCDACEGTGWVNQTIYRQAPEDQKA